MRLNKYIAHSGVCSRRKADELIQQGEVTVNGLQAECGYDVTEGDVVSVAGRTITPEKRLVYYIPVSYTHLFSIASVFLLGPSSKVR